MGELQYVMGKHNKGLDLPSLSGEEKFPEWSRIRDLKDVWVEEPPSSITVRTLADFIVFSIAIELF